jgi:hypothetical protein
MKRGRMALPYFVAMNSTFERYIGIDYSSAQTPTSSLQGLRVYAADRLTTPEEIPPPFSPRKYWTRRGIAEWLVFSHAGLRPHYFRAGTGIEAVTTFH